MHGEQRVKLVFCVILKTKGDLPPPLRPYCIKNLVFFKDMHSAWEVNTEPLSKCKGHLTTCVLRHRREAEV
jgi:hypothetical protein